MNDLETLRRFGLFDAKVPRYTSYPPANHFLPDVGHRHQRDWLTALDAAKPVSIYVHIPFCRRLCWFCACRTQGTQTLGPVEDYVTTLITEITAAAAKAPKGLRMGRLHLGGGTPTLLTGPQMTRLMTAIYEAFPRDKDFEFSVEVDPTEASEEVLTTLAAFGLNRASIGVQDFDPKVQEAIGRLQSIEETERVTDILRSFDIRSLNFDLLYGLPHQTEDSLQATLEHVLKMRPDRIALYGYAHVPHMSKRQVMINSDTLPDVETRFELAQSAGARLLRAGYSALGLDHFAVCTDSLYLASQKGALRRNFQGYTDDPCETLIGFGASAISKYPQGYAQNAVSTAAYTARVQDSGLAAHKGYATSEVDNLVADMIEDLMCKFAINVQKLQDAYPDHQTLIARLTDHMLHRFPGAFAITPGVITVNAGYEPAVRVFAAALDPKDVMQFSHSVAI